MYLQVNILEIIIDEKLAMQNLIFKNVLILPFL